MDGIISATPSGGTPGYTYSWNTNPASTNQQVNNVGSGIYTVTVTDINGCTQATNVVLTANPLPQISLPPVIYGCQGSAVVIDAQASGSTSCTWIFSDGQVVNECGPILMNFPSLDCYDMQLTAISPQGCVTSVSQTDFVCIKPNPLAGFYADNYEIGNIEGAADFWNTSIGADSYVWDFGDGSPTTTTFNAYHQFGGADFEEISYAVTLYATSEFGCMDTAIRFITVKPEIIFYVPNAFTPDGDNFNGIFKPVFSGGYNTQGYQFMIFNRWGELIYQTNVIEDGWDGTFKGQRVQEGVYTWKLNVKSALNDRKEVHVGHVTLLRGGGL